MNYLEAEDDGHGPVPMEVGAMKARKETNARRVTAKQSMAKVWESTTNVTSTAQEVVRQRHVGRWHEFFLCVASGGHDRCHRAPRPFRLCEAPAGLSLFSQRVRTVALHEHSGTNATMIGT